MEDANVLYVDDEPQNLRSFKLLFRKQYNVLTAESGKEGLEILKKNDIHLIITDQKMPQMSGIDFLKKVQTKWPEAKRILLTGFSDNEALKEAINDIGIDWYVNKPFNPDQMDLLIKTALKSYRTEAERRNVDQQLRSFLESASDAILTIDENQLITMINPAVVKLFGYTEKELLGKSIEILLAPDIKSHMSHVQNFEKSKDETRYMGHNSAVYGKSKSGRLIPIETTISKMQLHGKKFYNAIIRDITQRLEDENRLKQSEQHFRGLFEAITDMYVRSDMTGNCLMISPSVKQILGYEPEEFLNNSKKIHYKNPTDRERLIQKMSEQGFVRNFRFETIRKDGSTCTLSMNSDIVKDENGHPLYIQSMARDISDIISAEQTIEIQRERLLSATTAAHLGIWDWNLITGELIWEDSMFEIFKLDKHTFKPSFDALMQHLHPDDVDFVKQEANIAITGVKDFDSQFRLRWPNGTYRYIRGVGSVIRDNKGTALRMVGCNWDDTQSKLDAEKLRENALLFKESERMAHFGVWNWDLHKDAVEWSDELYRIYGLERGVYIPSFEGYISHIHPDDQEQVKKVLENVLTSKKQAKFEERIIRPDGAVRFLNSWITVIVDTKDKPIKLFGTCQDITELKHNEQALITRETELRSLAENAPNFIIKINKKLEIEYINKLLAPLKREDVIGVSVLGFIPEKDRKRVEKVLVNVFRTGKADSYETTGPSSIDKQTMWFTTSAGPVVENGVVTHIILFSTEITDKKQAEQKIRQMNEDLEQKVKLRTMELSTTNEFLKAAQQEVKDALIKEKELGELKSRFVSIASHQFRTPLTVIHSNIELLENNLDQIDDKLKPKHKKFYGRIKKEATRMTDLMDEVLILGKINAGVVQGSFQWVNLVKIAQEFTDQFNEVKEASNINLRVINTPREMWADDKLLSHVFLNLLHNAQKYSIQREDIDFTITFQAKQIKIEIKDLGIGISEEDQKHLFEPFHRGQNVNDIPGTGLGLAIVKEYVTINNGTIDVESALNKGTTIQLIFLSLK